MKIKTVLALFLALCLILASCAQDAHPVTEDDGTEGSIISENPSDGEGEGENGENESVLSNGFTPEALVFNNNLLDSYFVDQCIADTCTVALVAVNACAQPSLSQGNFSKTNYRFPRSPLQAFGSRFGRQVILPLELFSECY